MDLEAKLADEKRSHVRAQRCAGYVGIRRCALPTGHAFDHTLTPEVGTHVIGPDVVLVPLGRTSTPRVESLTEIADLLAQLGADGVSETSALLCVARRALDRAAASICNVRGEPARALWRALGKLSNDTGDVQREVDHMLHASPERITVQVSSSTYCFLQLDSSDHVAGYGLTDGDIECTRRGGAKISGTVETLAKFADFLHPAIVDGTDFTSSAKRSIKMDHARVLEAVAIARSKKGA